MYQTPKSDKLILDIMECVDHDWTKDEVGALEAVIAPLCKKLAAVKGLVQALQMGLDAMSMFPDEFADKHGSNRRPGKSIPKDEASIMFRATAVAAIAAYEESNHG